jgi:hypothetical protein
MRAPLRERGLHLPASSLGTRDAGSPYHEVAAFHLQATVGTAAIALELPYLQDLVLAAGDGLPTV